MEGRRRGEQVFRRRRRHQGRVGAERHRHQHLPDVRQGVRELRPKVEFNIESGNSGIQFRSFDRDRDQFRPRRQVFGYQAEITPDGGATGRIYDEERRGYRKGLIWLDKDTPQDRLNAAKAGFKKGGWNEMRILCEDGHIRTWLNGLAVADLKDDVDRFGYIGLQVHYAGPKPKDKPFKPSVVRFRNIRIKELPPEKNPWSKD